jgi:hypothetical protein
VFADTTYPLACTTPSSLIDFSTRDCFSYTLPSWAKAYEVVHNDLEYLLSL